MNRALDVSHALQCCGPPCCAGSTSRLLCGGIKASIYRVADEDVGSKRVWIYTGGSSGQGISRLTHISRGCICIMAFEYFYLVFEGNSITNTTPPAQLL